MWAATTDTGEATRGSFTRSTWKWQSPRASQTTKRAGAGRYANYEAEGHGESLRENYEATARSKSPRVSYVVATGHGASLREGCGATGQGKPPLPHPHTTRAVLPAGTGTSPPTTGDATQSYEARSEGAGV